MILILGTGFIGNALLVHLQSKNCEVRTFSNIPAAIPNENHIQGDITKIEQHKEIFEDITTIIHTIHTTVPSTSYKNEIYDVESNVIPFLNLLEICKNQQIQNFIYLSSGGAVYGNPTDEKAITENYPLNPVSSYGVTKLTIEKYLKIKQDYFKKNCVILRPSNIYGIGQDLSKPQGVISYLFDAFKNDKDFFVWGDGEGKKDYLFLDDLVKAIELVINYENKLDRNVFNIASGELLSLNEIISTFEHIFNKKVNITYKDSMPFDVKNVKLNPDLFMKTFGWQSEKSVESFINELYAEI